MTPAYYTLYEGGYFHHWGITVIGKLDAPLIPKKEKIQNFNGVGIHSFLFPTCDPKQFYRWDCLNGWTGVVTYSTL